MVILDGFHGHSETTQPFESGPVRCLKPNSEDKLVSTSTGVVVLAKPSTMKENSNVLGNSGEGATEVASTSE